ncbi:sarcosine oxidase subunit gamma [Roseovarius aestuarii]|uniref:Sarcosine oxidase, gamma subunit family n=1 Tax=Roseovarius aestuarii TaxID=475083 RepID=A0A1X7BMP9_9RHOB|nr:sarcosine oxidase subunit gamma family protein [Roseovarius aestuarii]SMC10559.1 Sarcosine oxidase, gamma subunit family [Roseovarius aestuarii]
MSKPVSALEGASYQGFAKVEEVGLRGMITIRGDLKSAGMKKAAAAATGLDVPGQREVKLDGDTALAWMSSDELLAMVPYAEVDDRIAAIDKALKGKHYLAVNVSDARAIFRLSGGNAREVIAKLSPVDMSSDAFGLGQIRRTRMAQVPAAFWVDETGAIMVVCFRSVAQYVFDLLKGAAENGNQVGYLN